MQIIKLIQIALLFLETGAMVRQPTCDNHSPTKLYQTTKVFFSSALNKAIFPTFIWMEVTVACIIYAVKRRETVFVFIINTAWCWMKHQVALGKFAGNLPTGHFRELI